MRSLPLLLFKFLDLDLVDGFWMEVQMISSKFSDFLGILQPLEYFCLLSIFRIGLTLVKHVHLLEQVLFRGACGQAFLGGQHALRTSLLIDEEVLVSDVVADELDLGVLSK